MDCLVCMLYPMGTNAFLLYIWLQHQWKNILQEGLLGSLGFTVCVLHDKYPLFHVNLGKKKKRLLGKYLFIAFIPDNSIKIILWTFCNIKCNNKQIKSFKCGYLKNPSTLGWQEMSVFHKTYLSLIIFIQKYDRVMFYFLPILKIY